jgi:hypothetical protein
MTVFEPPEDEQYGASDVPESLHPKMLDKVIAHERGTRRLCFMFAFTCLMVIIIIHMLEYDLDAGQFVASTKWGNIKGGIAIAILLLAYLTIRRGTAFKIRSVKE